jgi:hypothetical protein
VVLDNAGANGLVAADAVFLTQTNAAGTSQVSVARQLHASDLRGNPLSTPRDYYVPRLSSWLAGGSNFFLAPVPVPAQRAPGLTVISDQTLAAGQKSPLLFPPPSVEPSSITALLPLWIIEVLRSASGHGHH